MNKKACIRFIDEHVGLNPKYCKRAAEERGQTVKEFLTEFIRSTITHFNPTAESVADHYIEKWEKEKAFETEEEIL